MIIQNGFCQDVIIFNINYVRVCPIIVLYNFVNNLIIECACEHSLDQAGIALWLERLPWTGVMGPGTRPENRLCVLTISNHANFLCETDTWKTQVAIGAS